MSDSKTASKEPQEPSMEEILSSIRQIIASDEEPGGKSEAPADTAAAKGEQDQEEDVLELTEVVPAEEPAAGEAEPGSKSEAKPEPPPKPKNEPEAKSQPEAKPQPEANAGAEAKPGEKAPASDLAAVEQQAEQELAEREAELELVENEAPDPVAPAKEEKAMTDAATGNQALLSGEAAAAATGAFAKLARSVARPESEPIPAADGKTVEQLVAELMRPMLKEWLDQNLPAIVERVVEREVRKLARRAELL